MEILTLFPYPKPNPNPNHSNPNTNPNPNRNHSNPNPNPNPSGRQWHLPCGLEEARGRRCDESWPRRAGGGIDGAGPPRRAPGIAADPAIVGGGGAANPVGGGSLRQWRR